MSLKEKINANPKLKKLAIWALTPKNQPRPRLWVRLFLNPMVHKRGKGSRIKRMTRIDVLPWNNFTLGNNSVIEDFTTINNGVGDIIIGDRTRIGLGNTLIGPVKVGNDIMFAQNIVASGLNHGYEDISMSIHDQKVTTDQITIEDEAWIGANAVITAGVTIGKHAVVAAGSIVTKSVPPYSIVAGNPARLIKKYNFDSQKWEKA
jgi:acetyltransferase-like isoleucine patch superfamily enzyme